MNPKAQSQALSATRPAVELPPRVEFRQPERAALNLELIAARAPTGIVATLKTLLVESPDPDSAVNSFERLVSSANEELLRLLDLHRFLIHYAVVVFSASHFLAETLIQNSDLFYSLWRDKHLARSFSSEDFGQNLSRFRSRSLETDISRLLGRFKRREYVRIMLRDLLGIATLAETTAEISALSDVLLQEALREAEAAMRRRWGPPRPHAQNRRAGGTPEAAPSLETDGGTIQPPFSILSLGKLGGNELNYSSDVDLFYLYGDAEPSAHGKAAEEASGAISSREYFVRLAQQVTEMLSRPTADGPVFRIDLRLRPQGNEGEPAVGLSQALRYYAEIADDWELQAMIKVRYSAGSERLAREFIRGIQAYVYREEGETGPSPASADSGSGHAAPSSLTPRKREEKEEADPSLREGFRHAAPSSLTPRKRLNFAAIKTALVTREKIDFRRRQVRAPGAAGLDVKLEHGGIRDIEFLVQCLQRVYGGSEPWLRSRGTLFSLQKLHDKGHLSGKDYHELNSAYEFLRKIEHWLQLRRGRQVHRLPASRDELRILYRGVEAGRSGGYDAAEFARRVRQRMSAVSEIYKRIIFSQQEHGQEQSAGTEFRLSAPQMEGWRDQSYGQILRRLASDTPEIYAIAARAGLDAHARRNLGRFLSSALTSSERYAAVRHSSAAVERALELFAVSDYLTDILVQHPEEIATLAEIAAPPPAQAGGLFGEASRPASVAQARDGSGAAGGGSVQDPAFAYAISSAESRSEQLACLRRYYRHRVFASGARDLLQRRPVYDSLGETTSAATDAIHAGLQIAGNPEGFAVLALGRLGTGEFDLASDADLLFVRDQRLEVERARRTAEQFVQALSSYTREGMLFAVDLRLRPRGAEGELVATPADMERYFREEAQPWEALSYTKLVHVAGTREVGERAIGGVREQLARFGRQSDFGPAVRGMRERLERAEREWTLKTAPGGLYDIDFIISYSAVRHCLALCGTTRERLDALRQRGLLDQHDFATLDAAAELARMVEHVVRLVTGRARKSLPATERARRLSERLAAKIRGQSFPDGLRAELERHFAAVREVYDRILPLQAK